MLETTRVVYCIYITKVINFVDVFVSQSAFCECMQTLLVIVRYILKFSCHLGIIALAIVLLHSCNYFVYSHAIIPKSHSNPCDYPYTVYG